MVLLDLSLSGLPPPFVADGEVKMEEGGSREEDEVSEEEHATMRVEYHLPTKEKEAIMYHGDNSEDEDEEEDDSNDNDAPYKPRDSEEEDEVSHKPSDIESSKEVGSLSPSSGSTPVLQWKVCGR
jgi:hypothetical protein